MGLFMIFFEFLIKINKEYGLIQQVCNGRTQFSLFEAVKRKEEEGMGRFGAVGQLGSWESWVVD
jgi:hypothetical protein